MTILSSRSVPGCTDESDAFAPVTVTCTSSRAKDPWGQIGIRSLSQVRPSPFTHTKRALAIRTRASQAALMAKQAEGALRQMAVARRCGPSNTTSTRHNLVPDYLLAHRGMRR